MSWNTLGLVALTSIVVGYHFGVHERFIPADSARLRLACDHVDALLAAEPPRTASIASLPRSKPVLRFRVARVDPTCVPRTAAAGASISQARCLAEAPTLDAAHRCGESLF